jgi:malic enzyme
MGVKKSVDVLRVKSLYRSIAFTRQQRRRLRRLVTVDHLDSGTLYARFRDIRRISLEIAVAVAETAYKLKVAQARRPRNVKAAIARSMYEPCSSGSDHAAHS